MIFVFKYARKIRWLRRVGGGHGDEFGGEGAGVERAGVSGAVRDGGAMPGGAARDALGARLEARSGVMHVPQDPIVLEGLTHRVHGLSAFELAGFHDLVSLSGSLILAFAATHDLYNPKAIWDISRLDEIWQAEEWGKDEEAEAAAAVKEQAFLHAKQVFDLSRD